MQLYSNQSKGYRATLINAAILLGTASILGIATHTQSASAVSIKGNICTSGTTGARSCRTRRGAPGRSQVRKNQSATQTSHIVVDIIEEILGLFSSGNSSGTFSSGSEGLSIVVDQTSNSDTGAAGKTNSNLGSLPQGNLNIKISFSGFPTLSSYQSPVAYTPSVNGFFESNSSPVGGNGGLLASDSLSLYDTPVETIPEPTTIFGTILAAGGAHLINRKRKRLASKAKVAG